MTFGEWARRRVVRLGKNMAWLAREVGTSQSTLVKWRAGSMPRVDYFIGVCAAIARESNVSTMEIITEAIEVLGIYEGNTDSYKEAKSAKRSHR